MLKRILEKKEAFERAVVLGQEWFIIIYNIHNIILYKYIKVYKLCFNFTQLLIVFFFFILLIIHI